MYDYILSQPLAWPYRLKTRPALINLPQKSILFLEQEKTPS